MMVKFIFAALQLTVISAIAQEKPIAHVRTDWASQELRLSDLKSWGTKRYSFSAREPGRKEPNQLGVISLSTVVTEESIQLRDSWEFDYHGKHQSLAIFHTCRKDNFLTPTVIESKGKGDDELKTFIATVANGKARVRTEDGRETIRQIPQGTITMAAMMRLVTLVSKTPGNSYSFEKALESEELHLKSDYRLEVLQPEELTVGDNQVTHSKLRLSGQSIHPAYYWINEDGSLQRAMFDNRKVMELEHTP
jgi:hypothetical protein